MLQGSGGVSLFALQFALMHGARVVMTSSSDDKLQRLADLGASGLINYRETPAWHEEVMRITAGHGVDHVLSRWAGQLRPVVAMPASQRADQRDRLPGGQQGEINPLLILQRNARVRGIAVGPRNGFEAMNRAIEASGIRPLIDSRYDWSDFPQALRHLASGAHFGKVVLSLG